MILFYGKVSRIQRGIERYSKDQKFLQKYSREDFFQNASTKKINFYNIFYVSTPFLSATSFRKFLIISDCSLISTRKESWP